MVICEAFRFPRAGSSDSAGGCCVARVVDKVALEEVDSSLSGFCSVVNDTRVLNGGRTLPSTDIADHRLPRRAAEE